MSSLGAPSSWADSQACAPKTLTRTFRSHEDEIAPVREVGILRRMDRGDAIVMLDRLHAAQNEFYGGGDNQALRALLHPEITWTVPGSSPIAGTYRGATEVFAYFTRRRDRAARTFRMHRRDVLAGEGTRIAALTDGTASIDGAERGWSTVGLYDTVEDTRITACWLLPLDQAAFDAIWSR